jgi:hypothetical protein
MLWRLWANHFKQSKPPIMALCHAMATVGKSFQTEQATDHRIELNGSALKTWTLSLIARRQISTVIKYVVFHFAAE